MLWCLGCRWAGSESVWRGAPGVKTRRGARDPWEGRREGEGDWLGSGGGERVVAPRSVGEWVWVVWLTRWGAADGFVVRFSSLGSFLANNEKAFSMVPRWPPVRDPRVHARHSPRARRASTLALVVAAVCLIAQLAVFTAGLWHHHDLRDRAGTRPDDCAVCVAVHMERTSGLALPVLVLPPLVELGLVALPTYRTPSVRAHCLRLVRGPPSV